MDELLGTTILEISVLQEGPPSPLQLISKDLLEYYRYIEIRYLAILNLDQIIDPEITT